MPAAPGYTEGFPERPLDSVAEHLRSGSAGHNDYNTASCRQGSLLAVYNVGASFNPPAPSNDTSNFSAYMEARTFGQFPPHGLPS